MSGRVERFSSETVLARFRFKVGRVVDIKLCTKRVKTRQFNTALLSEQDLQFLEKINVALSKPRISAEAVKPMILIGFDLWTSFIKITEVVVRMPSGLLLQPFLDILFLAMEK
uniref:DNA/RNA polymerases superfamily protein n=1 Tax=Heterorhabditis bacteriophora TaxID=37862 RepID=A0A1I7WE46_HETBA